VFNPVVNAIILFAVGLVAGTLNVIAGGGSLLTLPVMIFLGLSPTVANGTNRVAILVQNVGASWSFQRKGLISRAWLLLAIPPAVAGAVLGTLLAVHIGDLAFQRILALVMVAVAAYTVWRPTPAAGGEVTPAPRGSRALVFAGTFFLVGFYGGFLQAGVGFVILAVTTAGGLDLVRGNAVKVTLVLAFTPLALALFAWSGKVDWIVGLALAAGNLLGGLMGVRLQILKGHAWVRNVVTVTIVVFAVKLLISG
jgi:uncharacterized membrane protein YfcA